MFANAFAKNKLLENRIRELGYEPSQFTLYSQIYRWYHELFRLPSILTPRYKEFLKQTKPNKDTKLICAQVRVGQISGEGHGDQSFMSRNDTVLYWSFIERNFIQNIF